MPPVSGRGTPVVPGNVGRVLWLNSVAAFFV